MECLQLTGAAAQQETHVEREVETVILIPIVKGIWFAETTIAKMIFHLQEAVGQVLLTAAFLVSSHRNLCDGHWLL